MKLVRFLFVIFFLLIFFCGYSQKKVRIACVGNNTNNELIIGGKSVNSCTCILGTMLGEKYEVYDFSENGSTLLVNGNSPYIKSLKYQKSLDFQPDLVFIKLGTIDARLVNSMYLNEFVQDYKKLIFSYQNQPRHPQVVLLLPPPISPSDSSVISVRIFEDDILTKIRQVAYETNCDVINLYNWLIENPYVVSGEIYSKPDVNTVIAKRIYEFVKMKIVKPSKLLSKLPQASEPFNFYGFQAYDFSFRNRNAKIVFPRHAAPGYPWVWRARFWGHEPQTDIALLERGFHIVYCDVAELYGNDESLSIWDDYYKFLTHSGLEKKAVMEGMSRGGIYVYRWAFTYPKRVLAIYADAPVLDMKSWPGGKGNSLGSNPDWETFKKDFNFSTDKEAMEFTGNPIDLTDKIGRSGYPMLHVVGDADDIVPVEENTFIFEHKIIEDGGTIQVIHKPGVGHHPHSLTNPQPIVDFILKANAGN